MKRRQWKPEQKAVRRSGFRGGGYPPLGLATSAVYDFGASAARSGVYALTNALDRDVHLGHAEQDQILDRVEDDGRAATIGAPLRFRFGYSSGCHGVAASRCGGAGAVGSCRWRHRRRSAPAPSWACCSSSPSHRVERPLQKPDIGVRSAENSRRKRNLRMRATSAFGKRDGLRTVRLDRHVVRHHHRGFRRPRHLRGVRTAATCIGAARVQRCAPMAESGPARRGKPDRAWATTRW